MRSVILQRKWAEVLLQGWLENKKLGWCLCKIFDIAPLTIVSSSDWKVMIEVLEESKVKPGIDQHSRLGCELKTWIALNATFASTALWQGRYEDAKKYFVLGGKDKKVIKPKRDPITRTIRARGLDKRSDWNTVK
jgi:hypothetical protein